MGDKTKIEWADASWNPVVGCSVYSAGCKNCYAMRMAHRMGWDLKIEKYAGLTELVNNKPVWNGVVRLVESDLGIPLRWQRGRRIFVNSMSDLFHESLPDAAIDKVFAVMAMAPRHTFMVLTKRSGRMREYMTDEKTKVHVVGEILKLPDHTHEGSMSWPLANVWLGVSTEDQENWDARLPDLNETPAATKFVSVEPMLGPIRAGAWLATVDQIIVGGESGGKRRRKFDCDWARALRDECAASGVAFYMKQVDKKTPIPDDLMIREWPKRKKIAA